MEQNWTTIITSNRSIIHFNWKELRNHWDLTWLLVHRTFVAQYKQTILGPTWAIMQPFFTTVVYSIFFGNIAGLGASGVPNFIFYLSGTVIWTLFAHCLTQTSNTFISNSAILSKVYFPRLVMPISTCISQFISFFIQFFFMLAFLVYYLFQQAGVRPNAFILLTPILIIQVALLGMGLGTVISSLTTKYRDLNMVLGFGVSLWSFCTPVAYDMFGRAPLRPGGAYYSLYMLNPMTPIINVFRYAFLGTGAIDWIYFGISWGVTLLFAWLGIIMFNRVEKTFMDTI